MADTKPTLTKEGKEELERELHELKHVRVEQNKKEISAARSYGDLSENSEYEEAKKEQGEIYGRIAELEDLLKNAVVVDIAEEQDNGVVGIGSIVKAVLHRDGRDEKKEYMIVGSYESDPYNNRISNESPIGRALIGHRAGDRCVAQLPHGKELAMDVLDVKR